MEEQLQIFLNEVSSRTGRDTVDAAIVLSEFGGDPRAVVAETVRRLGGNPDEMTDSIMSEFGITPETPDVSSDDTSIEGEAQQPETQTTLTEEEIRAAREGSVIRPGETKEKTFLGINSKFFLPVQPPTEQPETAEDEIPIDRGAVLGIPVFTPIAVPPEETRRVFIENNTKALEEAKQELQDTQVTFAGTSDEFKNLPEDERNVQRDNLVRGIGLNERVRENADFLLKFDKDNPNYLGPNWEEEYKASKLEQNKIADLVGILTNQANAAAKRNDAVEFEKLSAEVNTLIDQFNSLAVHTSAVESNPLVNDLFNAIDSSIELKQKRGTVLRDVVDKEEQIKKLQEQADKRFRDLKSDGRISVFKGAKEWANRRVGGFGAAVNNLTGDLIALTAAAGDAVGAEKFARDLRVGEGNSVLSLKLLEEENLTKKASKFQGQSREATFLNKDGDIKALPKDHSVVFENDQPAYIRDELGNRVDIDPETDGALLDELERKKGLVSEKTEGERSLGRLLNSAEQSMWDLGLTIATGSLGSTARGVRGLIAGSSFVQNFGDEYWAAIQAGDDPDLAGAVAGTKSALIAGLEVAVGNMEFNLARRGIRPDGNFSRKLKALPEEIAENVLTGKITRRQAYKAFFDGAKEAGSTTLGEVAEEVTQEVAAGMAEQILTGRPFEQDMADLENLIATTMVVTIAPGIASGVSASRGSRVNQLDVSLYHAAKNRQEFAQIASDMRSLGKITPEDFDAALVSVDKIGERIESLDVSEDVKLSLVRPIAVSEGKKELIASEGITESAKKKLREEIDALETTITNRINEAQTKTQPSEPGREEQTDTEIPATPEDTTEEPAGEEPAVSETEETPVEGPTPTPEPAAESTPRQRFLEIENRLAELDQQEFTEEVESETNQLVQERDAVPLTDADRKVLDRVKEVQKERDDISKDIAADERKIETLEKKRSEQEARAADPDKTNRSRKSAKTRADNITNEIAALRNTIQSKSREAVAKDDEANRVNQALTEVDDIKVGDILEDKTGSIAVTRVDDRSVVGTRTSIGGKKRGARIGKQKIINDVNAGDRFLFRETPQQIEAREAIPAAREKLDTLQQEGATRRDIKTARNRLAQLESGVPVPAEISQDELVPGFTYTSSRESIFTNTGNTISSIPEGHSIMFRDGRPVSIRDKSGNRTQIKQDVHEELLSELDRKQNQVSDKIVSSRESFEVVSAPEGGEVRVRNISGNRSPFKRNIISLLNDFNDPTVNVVPDIGEARIEGLRRALAETPVEDTDVTDADFEAFEADGTISNERANVIAQKLERNIPLTDREQQIFEEREDQITALRPPKEAATPVAELITEPPTPIPAQEKEPTEPKKTRAKKKSPTKTKANIGQDTVATLTAEEKSNLPNRLSNKTHKRKYSSGELSAKTNTRIFIPGTDRHYLVDFDLMTIELRDNDETFGLNIIRTRRFGVLPGKVIKGNYIIYNTGDVQKFLKAVENAKNEAKKGGAKIELELEVTKEDYIPTKTKQDAKARKKEEDQQEKDKEEKQERVQQEDEIKTKEVTSDNIKQRIARSADKLKTALTVLDKLLPSLQANGVKVFVTSKEGFIRVAEKGGANRQEAAQADSFYNPETKEIYINEGIRDPRASVHEAVHALTKDLLNDNPELVNTFADQILSDGSLKEFHEFASRYKDNAAKGEAVVQFIADRLFHDISRSQKPGLLKTAYNKLLDLMGFQTKAVNDLLSSDKSVKAFADNLSNFVISGGTVKLGGIEGIPAIPKRLRQAVRRAAIRGTVHVPVKVEGKKDINQLKKRLNIIPDSQIPRAEKNIKLIESILPGLSALKVGLTVHLNRPSLEFATTAFEFPVNARHLQGYYDHKNKTVHILLQDENADFTEPNALGHLVADKARNKPDIVEALVNDVLNLPETDGSTYSERLNEARKKGNLKEFLADIAFTTVLSESARTNPKQTKEIMSNVLSSLGFDGDAINNITSRDDALSALVDEMIYGFKKFRDMDSADIKRDTPLMFSLRDINDERSKRPFYDFIRNNINTIFAGATPLQVQTVLSEPPYNIDLDIGRISRIMGSPASNFIDPLERGVPRKIAQLVRDTVENDGVTRGEAITKVMESFNHRGSQYVGSRIEFEEAAQVGEIRLLDEEPSPNFIQRLVVKLEDIKKTGSHAKRMFNGVTRNGDMPMDIYEAELAGARKRQAAMARAGKNIADLNSFTSKFVTDPADRLLLSDLLNGRHGAENRILLNNIEDPVKREKIRKQLEKKIANMRDHINELQEVLRSSGFMWNSRKDIIENSIGEYTIRIYEAHTNPRWVDKVKGLIPVWQDAAKIVKANLRRRRDQLNKEADSIRLFETAANVAGGNFSHPSWTGLPPWMKERWNSLPGTYREKLRAIRVRDGEIETELRDVNDILGSDSALNDFMTGVLVQARDGDSVSATNRVLGRGVRSGTDKSLFIRRKDDTEFPPELRAFFGEIRDPIMLYSATISKLAAWDTSIKFQERLVKALRTQDLFSTRRDDTKGHTTPVEFPKDKFPVIHDQLFTEKLYMDEHLAEAMKGSVINQDAINAIMDVAWYQKGFAFFNAVAKWSSTVGSAVTHKRNFFGNFFVSLSNGLLMNPKWYKAFGKAWWRGIKDVTLTAARDTTRGWVYVPDIGNEITTEKLVRLGIEGSEVATNEIARDIAKSGLTSSLFRDDLPEEQLRRGTGKTIFKTIARSFRVAGSVANNVYAMSDTVFKVAAFTVEQDRSAQILFGKEVTELTPEQMNSVEEHAAATVRKTFPNYSEVYKWAKDFRGNVLFAPFISFYAEMFRNTRNIIAISANDIRFGLASAYKGNRGGLKRASVGVQRLIGLGINAGMLTGAGSAILSYIGLPIGPEDEEVDYLSDYATAPWDAWLMVKKVGPGKYEVGNLSTLNPYGQFTDPVLEFSRHPGEFDQGILAMALRLTEPLRSEQLGTGTMLEVFTNKDSFGDPVSEADPSINTGQYTKDVAAHILKTLVPKTGTDIVQWLKFQSKAEGAQNRIERKTEEVRALRAREEELIAANSPKKKLIHNLVKQQRKIDEEIEQLKELAQKNERKAEQLVDAANPATPFTQANFGIRWRTVTLGEIAFFEGVDFLKKKKSFSSIVDQSHGKRLPEVSEFTGSIITDKEVSEVYKEQNTNYQEALKDMRIFTKRSRDDVNFDPKEDIGKVFWKRLGIGFTSLTKEELTYISAETEDIPDLLISGLEPGTGLPSKDKPADLPESLKTIRKAN